MRKSVNLKFDKNNLDFSKLNLSNLKYSISPRGKRKSNGKNSLKGNVSFNLINKKVVGKQISLNSCKKKRYSCLNPIGISTSNIKSNGENSKRHSLEIFQNRTKKFYQRYNLKERGDYILNDKNFENCNCPSPLNLIEDNIKKVLNNLLVKIEEKKQNNVSQREETMSPEKKLNRLASSPNLKFVFIKKKMKNPKHNLHTSVLIKETNISDFSFHQNHGKKRSRSFDYNSHLKKKLIKRIRNRLLKNTNKKSTVIQPADPVLDDDDESDENKNIYGFSFDPNSNFILIFDIMLIVSNLYSFIFFPLHAAQNKALSDHDSILHEILCYSIDFIFFLDFIITLFRGYYNFEVNIIRNNKKIIIHYLKTFFLIDLIQSIPLYTIIRIFKNPSRKIYLTNTDPESLLFVLILFIKPFKIFKIIRKKQNKALEDLYLFLSESYYLEELVQFLMYFLIFFLFIHLFICLHIYFSLQNYPNWITKMDIINESFIDKYVASLYFMITTMTTVGYGDIVCVSFIERIYHIILLFIGTLLYTFLVSKIGNYLRDESHEQIKLSKDLNILESIRISYPTMPFKLYNKIKNHLLSIFKKRKKTGISLLINGVPDAIKNDLLFKIYSKVINGFIIFKEVKNSNFALQMLTSFIPVVSKKEEIIILEGEIIRNIVFVKDGRLSMEISIDLNDAYKSIIQNIENNFIGISKQEELTNYNILQRNNSGINDTEKSYNNLKEELDNFLIDNQKSNNNCSHADNNGISVDLGRLDFSRNEISETINENIQTIKIIDVRKNEYYGDVHMFLDQPSPFTLKAKTRIAELLLLRKYDALSISKNFPNIWRRIQNKSYHNLVSIKKLTYRTLKQYYNTHFYNNHDKTFANLDVTRKTNISGISFLKKLKTLNKSNNNNKSYYIINKSINQSINNIINKSFNKSISQSIIQSKNKNNNKSMSRSISQSNYRISNKSLNKNINKSKDTKSQKKEESFKNYVDKSKLFLGYEQKSKKDLDLFENELEFSEESNDNSNSNSNSFESSNFNFSNSIHESKKDLSPFMNIGRKDLIVNYQNTESPKKKIANKNSNCFTFKNSNEMKFSSTHSKIKLDNNIKSKLSTFNFGQNYKSSKISKKCDEEIIKEFTISKDLGKEKNNDEINVNKTLKYYRNSSRTNSEDNNKDNNKIKIITLKDVDAKFSKKIRKQIKKRKKLQKIREMLKIQKLKTNRSLIESNSKRNNSNDTLSHNNKHNLSYSGLSSSKKSIFSKIFDSSSSKEDSSTLIKISGKFDTSSLKQISSCSFEISSSYKNINILSKGEMIQNVKYQKFIENIVKKSVNKIEENNYKISVFSNKNKKEKKEKKVKKEGSIKYKETQSKKYNNNELFSEGKLTTISKQKYKNIILDEPNNMSNKKYIMFKTEKSTDNFPGSTGDLTGQKFKNFSKYFLKEIDDFEKIKLSAFKKGDKQSIKNLCSEENLLNEKYDENRIYTKKNTYRIKKDKIYKNKFDNKSFKSSLKSLNAIDKKSSCNLERNHSKNNINNSSLQIIQINNILEKSKNCYIF